MKARKWMVVCCAALLTFGGVSGCDSAKSSTEVTEAKNGKGKAESKNVSMEIESAEYVLPEEYEESANNRILKIKVNIKNKGNKPLPISQDDFSLYDGDTKMKEYYSSAKDLLRFQDLDEGKKTSGTLYYEVKESDSYELVYKKAPADYKEEEGKQEKLTFKIDGKELKKNTGNLNKPGEALTTYINAIFYDKDVEKVEKSTGENAEELVSIVQQDLELMLRKELGFTFLDSQLVEAYFQSLKDALKEKVEFKTMTLSMNSDGEGAEVELRAKPLMVNDLKSKIQGEVNKIMTENPDIEEEELLKRVFEFQTTILKEAPTSDTEKVVKIFMEKNGDGKWRVEDFYEGEVIKALVSF